MRFCRLFVFVCLGLMLSVRADPHSVKKGVGIPYYKFSDSRERLERLNLNWFYTWNTSTPEDMPESIEFIPMIWGSWNNRLEVYQQLMAEDHQTLLGFNEPDYTNQANLSVEYVINSWTNLMNTGLRLGSPGCLNAKSAWMRKFMDAAAVSEYRVDFVTVHYYPPSAAAFLKYIHNVHELYQLPIWITEFAITDKYVDTPADVCRFMEEVIPVLESLDYVERYAWVVLKDNDRFDHSALFNEDGSLTEPGRLYSSF